jgi:hypothetical protein
MQSKSHVPLLAHFATPPAGVGQGVHRSPQDSTLLLLLHVSPQA